MTVHRKPFWKRAKARVLALPLVTTAALAAAAMASTAGSPAPAGATSRATPVKHIVVLYLENHTFDNIFGFYCQHAARCGPGDAMPGSVVLSNGAHVTPRALPDKVPIVVHTVGSQQAAINGGRMNGWQKIKGCGAVVHFRCVGGYQPSQIPNVTRLASNFAISDRTFSMADSPSWGGHLYAAMASLDGFLGNNPQPAHGVRPSPGWGCDSHLIAKWQSPSGAQRWVPSCVPDPSLRLPNGGAFKPTPVHNAPTIMDRLSAAGQSWHLYGAHAGQPGYVWSLCASVAECLFTGQAQQVRPDAQFIRDASAGNLPSLSVITPGGPRTAASEHNGFSMTVGDNWIGQIASAVMNGPQWNSTALFITWDDCGCFYDSMAPGVNPDGTAQGPRVPLVIVSPFANPGFIDKTPTTFAGILAYVEQTFGLAPLSSNDAQAYAFGNAFNYSRAPLKPVPMVTRRLPRDAYHVNWAQAKQDT